MFINWNRRELELKIVYYGPALSGKTTNLEYIHAKTNPALRGDLVSLKTRAGRTIFFDYMQLELGQVKGLRPKFNLYTVPGQAYYAATRKLVLRGVDGIVFVADSQAALMNDNLESLQDMRKYLQELGYNPATVPVVVQFNKRDLPDILPVPIMRQRLGLDGMPCFEAVAIQGTGVFDTLKAIINAVVRNVQSSFQ